MPPQKPKAFNLRTQLNEVKELTIEFLRSHAFDQLIDLLVFFNALYVGLSVDNTSLPDLRIIFCVAYILEFLVRFIVDKMDLLWRYHLLKVEALIVVVACLGAFVFTSDEIWFRLSVFRVVRIVRVLNLAKRSKRLAELWLVIAGIGKAMRTLIWLMIFLILTCCIFGLTARGLVYNGDDDSDLTNAPCGGDVFRIHISCIDIDEYFGDIMKTALTMLQVVTLDRWTGHIVRPLSGMRPFAAAAIFCFVIVTTYCLLSIAVGVLVWSTVELAKQHDTHRENVILVQDTELIQDLRDYFDNTLKLDDREYLDYKELQEGMLVPQVKHAYQTLDLPVTDVKQLWMHLDQDRRGEITMEEFEHGCLSLLEPAKRYDMACLAAKLHGRAAFGQHLEVRCDEVVKDMSLVSKKLKYGFTVMKQYVQSEDVNILIPEVGLRSRGKMYIPPVIIDDDD
jgi:hypothetical protein